MSVSGIGAARVIGADNAISGRRLASGFRVAGEAGATAAGAVSATDVASGAILLALQEAEDDGVRDRAAQSRARDLMTELAALQRDVLRGRVSGANFERLAKLGEAVPIAAAPALRAVLAGVVLRARVELARYDAYRPRSEP